MPLRHAALSAALLLALAACGGSGSKTHASGSEFMNPGQDCLGCHNEFTAAGTVYASATADATAGVGGVAVTIYGSRQDVHLTTNSAGNFYTTADFGYGAASVDVGGRPMGPSLADHTYGGCNRCHGSTSRIHVP